jgi:hypothetical protein
MVGSQLKRSQPETASQRRRARDVSIAMVRSLRDTSAGCLGPQHMRPRDGLGKNPASLDTLETAAGRGRPAFGGRRLIPKLQGWSFGLRTDSAHSPWRSGRGSIDHRPQKGIHAGPA